MLSASALTMSFGRHAYRHHVFENRMPLSVAHCFVMNRCQSRWRIMKNVICQCISNVTMRYLSLTDKWWTVLLVSFPLILWIIFQTDLRIHLGNIRSPRCFLTVLDISASFSCSNAISIPVNLGWFTFEPPEGTVVLFDCIFTSISRPWFIEMFWYCWSFRNSPLQLKFH